LARRSKGFGHGEKSMRSEVSIHLPPLTPFSSAVTTSAFNYFIYLIFLVMVRM
jgi:hypothetical protein